MSLMAFDTAESYRFGPSQAGRRAMVALAAQGTPEQAKG